MNYAINKGRVISYLMIAGLFFVAGCWTVVRAQDEVIRVESSLVSVPVTVLDRDGRHLTNLQKSNFRVYEEGTVQEIEVFEPVDTKISVVLLLDVSGSMMFDMQELEAAAESFVHNLRPYDQIMVATFSDQIKTVRDFSTVEQFRKRDPMKLRIDGRPPVTMVYDAADFALKKVARVKGRQAIVFLTDGIGDGIWSSQKSNFKLAEEGDASIYTIGFDTNPSAQSKYESNDIYQKRLAAASNAVVYLQDLARKSGGRAFRIANIQSLNQTFGEVVKELSRQYTLGYYSNQPGKDGERRKITVKVNVPNVAVRSRNEVIYKKPKRDIR